MLLDEDVDEYEFRNYSVECCGNLLDELKERMGHSVCIIEEPNSISSEHSIGAFVPDEDGVVRPQAY